MKMIVGLGNPGKKYEKTKHNVGFMVMDRLAEHYQAIFKKNPFEAEIAEFFVKGEKILLVKPQTFMNESGRSVGPLMTYFGVYPEELVVVYDDLDLGIGKIRLRQKGSAGGHNGMKSLIAHLKTSDIQRVKIGIDRPKPSMTVVNHVLSGFDQQDEPVIEDSLEKAVAACIHYIENNDFVAAMNAFN